MAAHQKKTRRLNAALVFADESGLLMAPLVQRSWSRRGLTPVLRQRTRQHQKVSVIAALIVSPHRQRVRLCFRLYPARNVDGDKVRAFLRQLRCHVHGRFVLLWDRLGAHRCARVQAYVRRHRRIHLEWFPAYAPELNPMEYGWSWLKTKPLANYAPPDAKDLATTARRHACRLQHSVRLLWSFIDHSPLSLRHK